MDIRISEQYVGRTLLSYLKFTLKISSACITKLKQDPHGLEINGTHVTVRYVLKFNDMLHINIDDSSDADNTNISPMPIPIDIIYEDENIFVINKPPFMPTHPSHNHHDDTLANALAFIYRERGIPLVFRPVGRLDKNTSGITVIAKNMASAAHFTNERKNNNVRKSYIAILCGELKQTNGFIDSPMKRQQDSVIMRTVCNLDEPGAMAAKTDWELLYSGNGISLVRAYPETGRTHQIRVHFQSIGYPLLGDDLYGQPSEYISRHALHAYNIYFTLPFSHESKHVVADVPDDIRNAFFSITGNDISLYLNT
ncbi:MAG: RluA family pseudouridine synthase [Ruminococcaceae bacterium]|nr:RluA family pseudouridine synthase [Oscillospiraceae bacterium]